MPVYQYRGYKADGAAATGIVDAESPKVARLKLRKDGVFPTEMAEQEGATRGIAARPESISGASSGRSQILTVTDVALMTRQLATLLVSGLPLVDALGVLMDQTEKKAIKGLIADLREAIRGGASYSAILERYPRDFSPIYVHMVRAGEASGAQEASTRWVHERPSLSAPDPELVKPAFPKEQTDGREDRQGDRPGHELRRTLKHRGAVDGDQQRHQEPGAEAHTFPSIRSSASDARCTRASG